MEEFVSIEFDILFKVSFELCFETIIFEVNKDEVFSKIIWSIVCLFFGSQSRWSKPIAVITLAKFDLIIEHASALWNKPLSKRLILFLNFLAL